MLINDIALEILNHKGWLIGLRSVVPHGRSKDTVALAPSFKPDQVDAMLRVEIGRDQEEQFARWCSENSRQYFDASMIGPHKLMGVSIYIVEHLPAPGWRVINPMKEQPRG